MLEISKQEKNKALKMLYHANLRNVGVFTSIALSILVYARYFKDKSKVSNVMFVLVGISFLSIATYLNFMLMDELNNTKKEEKSTGIIKLIDGMLVIPYFITIINLLILVFTILIKLGKI
tara:strand:- start:68 stop:427 length:360 start_codon:yes stop_codon:yes gene_type:complete